MNRSQSLSILTVVLAGCASSPTNERDVNRYAFLDPATGITYSIPLRFNLSTGLASLASGSSSASLEEYIAGNEPVSPRREAKSTVAAVSTLTRTSVAQDVPARIALIEPLEKTAPALSAVSVREAAPVPTPIASAPQPAALSLKLDTEFESAKRLIRFAFGAASLGPLGKRAVAELLPWAKRAEKVLVRGGADPSGNEVQNRELAMARATAVSTAFIAGGVDRDKIAKTYCTDCYVASNDTSEGRRMNRRVDVELVLRKELHAKLPAPVYAPKIPDSVPLIQASALR